MKMRVPLVFFGSVLAAIVLCGRPALAATPLAITATNVTMPSVTNVTTSGGVTSIPLGGSQVTVTGLQGSGTVQIGCSYTGPATTAKIPQVCGPVGDPVIPIATGETTLNGAVEFVPYGMGPIPGIGKLYGAPSPWSHLPAAGMALAGALLLGFGLRPRVRRRLFLAVLAAGALASGSAISGCGGNSFSDAMTPGTYQYTITADYEANPLTPLGQQVSTNITLTIQ